MLSISLPLVMVALTGQFVPGIAVLRNDGYQTQASPIIASNALTSLILAPFGCHGLNLAAITAAFWGLIFGLFAHLLLHLRRPAPQVSRAGVQAD